MRITWPAKIYSRSPPPAAARTTSETSQDGEKNEKSEQPHPDNVAEVSDEESIVKDAQEGVRAVEAALSVWTTWELVTAYVLIWLIYFVASTEEVIARNLTPYVTSTFSLHSLTSATYIMSNIIAGLTRLPLAKILDTWGRPQGMSLMLLVWICGFIMTAACQNVQTFAAANVFKTTGAQGISYCVTVFISDTSALKSRPLMLAIATTPYIITSWTGGPISQRILEPGGCGWRWGFGIFAILVFVTTAPLIYIFWRNYKKAIRMGVIERKPWNVTLGRVKNYLVEVDAVGILLLAGGLALFLLPFSLYSYQKDQWASPLIISFLVVGVVLIAAFVLYEKYLAPVTFIPYSLLADRTIFFGGIMFLLVFFNSMVWGSYFFSMLQVVFFQSIPAASNISAIYRVGSCAFAIVAGLAIRWSGRFKWMNLYFAVPLMILGVALMIPFRQPGTSIGLIIMTQIFVACAGGTIVIVGELAMMAPAGHQHIAVIIAILNLFGSVGSAVGGSVATAIWTSVFKKGLQRNLEGLRGLDGNLISWEQVYGSILWQTLYKRGTPARDAINAAYGEAQRIMLIASVVLLVGAWFCVLFWRDIDVKHMKQVRGRVF